MNRDFPETRRSELTELLRQGRKIEAIKVYREETAAGLKEAKDAIEELEASFEIRHPAANSPQTGIPRDPFEEKPQGKGCTVTPVLLTGGFLLLVTLLF